MFRWIKLNIWQNFTGPLRKDLESFIFYGKNLDQVPYINSIEILN